MVMAISFTANAQTGKKASKESEVKYSVSIDCENCKKKVEAVLPYVKGVKDIKVDLAARSVWVKYDNTKTNKETLASEIKKIGYDATEVVVEKK